MKKYIQYVTIKTLHYLPSKESWVYKPLTRITVLQLIFAESKWISFCCLCVSSYLNLCSIFSSKLSYNSNKLICRYYFGLVSISPFLEMFNKNIVSLIKSWRRRHVCTLLWQVICTWYGTFNIRNYVSLVVL